MGGTGAKRKARWRRGCKVAALGAGLGAVPGISGFETLRARGLKLMMISGDNILSRRPFIASVKAVIADATGIDAWARLVPPMVELPLRERQWMLQDFRQWEAGLPATWRSLYRAPDDADAKIVAIRRA